MKLTRIGLAATMVVCCSVFFCPSAEAVCEEGLPSTGLRDDVLIIVNDNSADSCEVATHYALARGLGSDNIVHVWTPASFFMNWTQFTILRDQIINYMQQQVQKSDPTFVPILCTGSSSPYYCQQSMDQLSSRTSVRYIVTTRGVPTRVSVDGSQLANQSAPTSVDNYLTYWLINYFASDTSFGALSVNRAQAFGDGSGMREIVPSSDRELIVGRIDGLNLQAANQLVDRAVTAEQKGIYGKLYGNYGHSLNDMGLHNWSTGISNYEYGDYSSSWRWQFSQFHETDPVCFDYTQPANYLNSPYYSQAGKSPDYCSVRISSGVLNTSDNDTPPGTVNSRSPLPSNALVYLGNLNGQATGYNIFTNFLNWRRDSTCTSALCTNASDPSACNLASTDIFKEIDTRCVGVADGFIGYNFQSFPVSYLTAVPTYWTLPMLQDSGGNGDLYPVGLPIVRTDTGYDDNYSLWFYNPDQVASPVCFANSSVFGAPATLNCPEQKFIKIEQALNIQQNHISILGNPDRYRVRLHYSTTSLSQPTNLTVRAFIERDDVLYNFNFNDVLMSPQIPAGTMGTSSNPLWSQSPAEAIITLDPALFPGNGSIPKWDGNYSNLRLWIFTDQYSPFSGAIGIDAVSVNQIDNNGNVVNQLDANNNVYTELVQNGSFANGHQQSSVGDFAANFLSRLNGTAFWGSLSHHESGGVSFSTHPVDTLTYFLRGLPLGDSVWFSEPHNSGILYGDPLYSPVAVRLFPVGTALLGQQLTITGNAVNGNDSGQVGTNYLVEYCAGNDFFVCQQQNAWKSTGIAGIWGGRGIVFGTWNTGAISPAVQGPYVLRLSVTSTSKLTGAQQTFSDYANTYIYTDWNAAYNDNTINPPVSSCPNKRIYNARTSIGYDSLDQAISEASRGDVIKLQNKAVVTSNTLLLDKDITLDGGYDCQYANKIGLVVSTIKGETNVLNGTATISDVLLESSDPSLTNTSNFTLTGTMQAGSTVAVSISNGATASSVTYPTSTTWSCIINGLHLGDNVITITTTSATGEQATTTTTVTYNPTLAVPAMGPMTILLSVALLIIVSRRLHSKSWI